MRACLASSTNCLSYSKRWTLKIYWLDNASSPSSSSLVIQGTLAVHEGRSDSSFLQPAPTKMSGLSNQGLRALQRHRCLVFKSSTRPRSLARLDGVESPSADAQVSPPRLNRPLVLSSSPRFVLFPSFCPHLLLRSSSPLIEFLLQPKPQNKNIYIQKHLQLLSNHWPLIMSPMATSGVNLTFVHGSLTILTNATVPFQSPQMNSWANNSIVVNTIRFFLGGVIVPYTLYWIVQWCRCLSSNRTVARRQGLSLPCERSCRTALADKASTFQLVIVAAASLGLRCLASTLGTKPLIAISASIWTSLSFQTSRAVSVTC